MAVYRVKIPGMKPVLLRDSSRPKALEQLMSVEALSGEQMADALAAGESIYKPGDSVEAEEKPPAAAAASPADKSESQKD